MRRKAHFLILQIHALEVVEIVEIGFYELIIEFGESLLSDDAYNSKEEELLSYFCIIDYNGRYKHSD